MYDYPVIDYYFETIRRVGTSRLLADSFFEAEYFPSWKANTASTRRGYRTFLLRNISFQALDPIALDAQILDREFLWIARLFRSVGPLWRDSWMLMGRCHLPVRCENEEREEMRMGFPAGADDDRKSIKRV